MKARAKPGASTLERLYLEHEERVRWVVRARGVSEASVDDLVHESFVAIHRRWAQRDPSVPAAMWIAGVARNVAFSHRRSEARRARHLQALPSPVAAPSPEDVVAGREAWTALQDFTQTLSPKLREVFLLSEVGGMPVSEVGEFTGVPVATLHSRLRLARGRFEEYFASVPTVSGRRALLRRAASQQAASPQERRGSMAAFVAAAGAEAPLAAVGATAGAWKIAALVSAAAVAGMLTTAAVLDPVPGTTAPLRSRIAQPSRFDTHASSRSASVASVADGDAEPAQTPTTNAPDSRAPPILANRPEIGTRRDARPEAGAAPAESSAGVADEAGTDALAAHLEVLRRARGLSRQGDHTAALALLDAVARRAPTLARDHHRLALRAACGAGMVKRSREAARALGQLGLPADIDSPCGTQKESPAQ